MGLLDTVRSAVDRTTRDWFAMYGIQPAQRMLTPNQAWGRGMDWGYSRAATGESIDLDKAMTLPVFQRCVNLYVDDIAQLPWDTYRRDGTARVPIDPPEWMRQPTADVNYTWTDHVSDVVFSLVTDRNAFLYCLPSRFSPVVIEVLDPKDVDVKVYGMSSTYTRRSNRTELEPSQLVHIRAPKSPGKGRATSRVDMLKETIALGLAAEEYGGRFFAQGATMAGMVEVPAGVTVDPIQLREQMTKAHSGTQNSHAFGVLTGGATFKPTQSNARDSQLLELHESVIEDVARGFGIPPYLAGSTSPGAVAYASTSNARVDYVVHGVVGLVHRIENAYSSLVPGADTFVKLNLNALLRGDQAARFSAYQVGLNSRFITKDEVRALEDFGPADDALGVDTENGGYLDTPNNNAPGEQPPAPPQAAQEPRSEPMSLTVNMPPPPAVSVTTSPVTFTSPDADGAIRATDLMVADNREHLQLMEVAVVEANQHTRDYVEARLAGMDERLERAETQRQADIARITAIPNVVREVTQRDEHGRPLKVTERRGDVFVQKLIERDGSGSIIRVTEVAA